MEIRQLIRDVRRNLVVAMAAFVLCVVAGGAAAFLPAKHYTASTLVAVQAAPSAIGTGSNVAGVDLHRRSPAPGRGHQRHQPGPRPRQRPRAVPGPSALRSTPPSTRARSS